MSADLDKLSQKLYNYHDVTLFTSLKQPSVCTYFVLNIIVTQFQTIWNDKSIGLRLKLMIHNTQEINFVFYKMTDVWKHQTVVIKVTTNP